MLSDCTKGFLYSQISSGWITRWNGSKNSVKLKNNNFFLSLLLFFVLFF